MDEIMLARQPIFDATLTVRFYEILFRRANNQDARITDGDQATRSVLLNLFTELDQHKVTGDHLAFINLTRNLLLDDVVQSFPKDKIVIEILEDTRIDDEIISHITALKNQGYRIALDDFIYRDDWEPLMPIANFFKLDVMNNDATALEATIMQCKKHPGALLAEKVETHEQLRYYLDKGFSYFQGYFLCEPIIVTGSTLAANKTVLLNIISTLQQPEADITEISAIISQDAGLGFKLLRILNSAAYSLPRQINSLQEAVVLLGREQIAKLVNMILLTNVTDKPHELATLGATRARHCELLAEHMQVTRGAYFTAGLFSILDALMDTPLDHLLAEIPLSDTLKAALLTHSGTLGTVLKLVIDYEQGNWCAVHDNALFDAVTLYQTYVEAITWTQAAIDSMRS